MTKHNYRQERAYYAVEALVMIGLSIVSFMLTREQWYAAAYLQGFVVGMLLVMCLLAACCCIWLAATAHQILREQQDEQRWARRIDEIKGH